MIDGNGAYFELSCDICGDIADEEFDSFYEAVEWKKDKENGWISRKRAGDWEDVCPECKS